MNQPASIYPKALKKGDTIGVIAPSSAWDVDLLAPATSFLEDAGFKVVLHPQTKLKHYQFAGTPEDKLEALHDYFADSDIDAIFCTCGGNGIIHYLDQIDYNLIKQNPKIFMGFSDITLLLNAIYSQTSLVTFHGPTLTTISRFGDKWRQDMLDVLTGQKSTFKMDTKGVEMEGTLIGGNLSVMQALIGTPYAPNLKGAILMLEDINDHLSRYDRMIAHMKQAGWLKNLNGIILGEFKNSKDNPERPFGYDIMDMIQNHAPDTPVITNAPIGHGENLCTLPIGAKVCLKNNSLSFNKLSS